MMLRDKVALITGMSQSKLRGSRISWQRRTFIARSEFRRGHAHRIRAIP
jgi:hypothetical protein